MYDHYKLSRQVAPSSLELHIDNSQQPLLLLAMSSLASKLDLINDHFASCLRCKENAELNLCDILGDSGASHNFTNKLKDFTEYEEITNAPSIQTASKDNQLQMHGQGAVFLTHEIFEKGRQVEITTWLYLVFYIPSLSIRLLSLGSLLMNGGTKSRLTFYKGSSIKMQLNSHKIGDTIFWLGAQVTPAANLLAKLTVFTVDYGLLHCHFGHPSKEVL